MVRLASFPRVDKTPRRFVVSASEGVETVVGPSSAAPSTGNVLPAGTEGRSETVWSVKGWPGDRGKGDKTFVLLEGVGWAKLGDGGNGRGGGLEEVQLPPAEAEESSGQGENGASGSGRPA